MFNLIFNYFFIYRVKKPVEVVYKTAVYNMKNEKLTKPVKTKEAKGPRYINDIICGSKVKKSSTDKQRKSKYSQDYIFSGKMNFFS